MLPDRDPQLGSRPLRRRYHRDTRRKAGTPAQLAKPDDFARDLRDRVGGSVRADLSDRLLYSTDASVYKQVPRAVLIPRSIEDLHAAVAVCREHGVSITPRGAGTSLEGQAIGPGLVIDCSPNLNGVLAVDPDAMTATVRPGIVQEDLRRQLLPFGLMLGPDTATVDRATVGGMAGNNSSGARSIVYGKTVDALVSAKFLLSGGDEIELGAIGEDEADGVARAGGTRGRVLAEALRVRRDLAGEIEARYPKVMRRVAGYNLDELVRPEGLHLGKAVVGSEGTLGIFTELTLRLVRPPKAVGTALVHFDTLREALEATVAVVERLGPSAVELVDALIVELARESPTYRRYTRFVVGRPESLLLVEFFADSEREAAAKVDGLEALLSSKGLGRDLIRLDTPDEVQEAWALRKAGLPLLMALPGDAKPIAFVEDCAVPVDRLPEYVDGTKEIFGRFGAQAGYYAHASVGCLHVRPVLDLRKASDVRAMRQISAEVCDLAMSLGGCISGEHGDGYAKSEHLERQFGPTLVEAFRRWKAAFDPDGLMNPGKIVDPQPLDQNLRLGSSYRPPAIRTRLDFSREGGFAAAAELCNGNAACRKLAGTMCPSYMVTRDERDTTRARANMLRSIMDGTLPPNELTGRAMHDVMDLCVGCKGCRSECPTGVDVAKLKTEFLAHYRAEHGVSLRSRLFSDPARMFRLARPFAPVANALGSSRLSSRVKRRLGIALERDLPKVARRGFRRTARTTRDGPRGRVALFVDTFTEYLYPEIGHAAVKVLDAMGFGVELPRTVCCGRPLLHEGLVDRARGRAETNYRRLSVLAGGVEAIIVLEPSCASVLAEDMAWLVPEARSLRGKVKLFEEFVAERGTAGAFAGGGSVLLHGHCHAKALWGTDPSVAALMLASDSDVEVVDSGCCGMAGSFGFEAEHLDVSVAMGERSLFPAVRATERTVVAAGTSCRQQIRFGTGVLALHPAEYLASRLAPRS